MLDEIDSLAVKREYGGGGASAEVSRSTTCLLQLLDAVTNDHVIIAATNLINDVDTAVKRRFTESMSYIGFQRKTMSGLSDSTLTMQGFLMIWILLESMLQKIIHRLKL